MTTHADPQHPLQTADMPLWRHRARIALVRDQIGRLELAGETNAAELLKEWYLQQGKA